MKNKKVKKESTEKVSAKFVNIIKKRWLISGTNTILLIAILIAIFILINAIIKSLELIPIDCTTSKEYTLTDESKDRIKDVTNQVNIYFVGYEQEDGAVTLAKQYKKSNENINIEVVDLNERTDLADKYGLTNDYNTIIIENDERSKILSQNDLYTYDSNYNTIDVTEEKLTSAILNITTEEIPTVYFLTGYSDVSLDYTGGLYYFSAYLENEILTYENLNMAVTERVPDDCATLIVTTPKKDFDELTTNAIIDYINKGGNILWLNSHYESKLELPNVNKILALYGVKPFDAGIVYETDSSKTAWQDNKCIVEDITGYTDIDSDLVRVILWRATKINIDEENLENLNVVKNDIITTSDTAYFANEAGNYTLGAMLTKTLSSSEDENEKKSELVIFGNTEFIKDTAVVPNYTNPLLFYENNKDLALNSIAFLTDQDVDITIRKDYTAESTYSATDAEIMAIVMIIIILPIAIIMLGIIIWFIRRRKK